MRGYHLLFVRFCWLLLVIGCLIILVACAQGNVRSDNQPSGYNTIQTSSPAAINLSTPHSPGTPEPTSTPEATTTLSPTTLPPVDEMLALGDYHTCHLHSDGTVSCWGWNAYGQTGNTTLGDAEESVIPNLTGITQISAGAYHTCALNWRGQVFCWGRNNVGQLGNDKVGDSIQPVQVVGLTDQTIRQINAGSTHTCALSQIGAAFCWGSNKDEKLGAGSVNTYSRQALPVAGLNSPVIQLSAGGNHTCAMDVLGRAWCWGDGKDGIPGQADFVSQPQPVMVKGMTVPLIRITSGWYHVCVQTTEAKVNCWGGNEKGQLGNASTVAPGRIVPAVGLYGGVTHLSAGGQQTCALKDGEIYCWGDDYLHEGSSAIVYSHLTPYRIPIKEPIKSLQLGGSHSCVITTNGEIKCWGANDHNQLGDYQIIFPKPIIPVE